MNVITHQDEFKSRSGVSNSNWLESHITKKKCSAGRILKGKKLTRAAYHWKSYENKLNLFKMYNIVNFLDICGPFKCGPNAARSRWCTDLLIIFSSFHTVSRTSVHDFKSNYKIYLLVHLSQFNIDKNKQYRSWKRDVSFVHFLWIDFAFKVCVNDVGKKRTSVLSLLNCWLSNNNITNVSFTCLILYKLKQDEVAEWLRRWTANPLGSARVGSNPILVVSFLS
jgi:hypothetical protein